ncbi:MAG: FhaA domain-containing protein [Egibacteraceae bacterium]
MGVLKDFEKRLEGAVEGFFARAFRSGLQPVELAKAIQRYARDYQQVGLTGVTVPNVFRFDVAPADLQRFSGYGEPLERELAGVAKATARDHGWQLQGPARVSLQANPDIPVGRYELRGKIEAASARDEPPRNARRPARAAPPAEATQFLPARGERATIKVLDGSGNRVTVDGSALMGRLPECDVTISDTSVSRRHARILREHGRWLVEDLGSTNGVRVNGAKVGRAPLDDGDQIELGSVRLAFDLEG